MLIRTPQMDDRAFLQQAIDYCEANNAKLTLKQNHTYNLSGALYFTGLNLEGNGATLSQTVANEPILMSRALFDKSGGIGAKVHIRNLTFKGNMDNPENHGLYIVTFWSRYENLEFHDTGGSAIYLTTNHKDGSLLATGTLVENMFSNITVRNSGGIALLMGELHGNNKITDGVLENILISTGASRAIYIGSGAGWVIRGVHTYASSDISKIGIHISNAFNTTVSDIYIECYTDYAFMFDAVQRNLSLSNINLTVDFAPNGHAIIYFDRQLIAGQEDAGVSINNLNIYNSNENLQAYIFEMVNTIQIEVSGLTVTGGGKNNIIFSTDTSSNTRYRYMLDASVEGRICDYSSKQYLEYEGRQLKQANSAVFWGNEEFSVQENFSLPVIYEYGKILCNVSIHGSKWHDGDKVCTWIGQIYISRKTTGYTLYVTNIVEPTGFAVTPSAVINEDETLSLSFTPTSEANGVVILDYVVCPN